MLLQRLEVRGSDLTFACVGTDRSTGDCLGPISGDLLLSLGVPLDQVVGTLENPLHATNIEDRRRQWEKATKPRFVIAIDAGLGTLEAVGALTLSNSSLRPGFAVGKQIAPVGDVSITGVVNFLAADLSSQILASTRLYEVRILAQMIASGCAGAWRHLARMEARDGS